MKMITDVHTHSDFSFDGNEPLSKILEEAYKKGVAFYGVSEHFDGEIYLDSGEAKPEHMPVWAFHGAVDGVVSPTQSDEMVAALKARGADVTYTRVDGVGHDVWGCAYHEELLLWLLSKKR